MDSSRIHVLFKSTWNILKDGSHVDHKASLGKLKKIEIISTIFSNHNILRLAVNYKEKKCKKTQTLGG